MLTEQNQESVLRPFRTLIGQCDSELTIARATLAEREKDPLINSSELKVPSEELRRKVQQLEKSKTAVEQFIEEQLPRLKLPDTELEQTATELRPHYVDLTLAFNEARSLLNYKYSLVEKNKINRRITAINSSRMLSNPDMQALQELWTDLLGMENDERLASSKKSFEDHLGDWEKVIAKKR